MLIPTRVGRAVKAAATAADGLPAEIYRNRGRLAVWQTVTDPADESPLRMAMNVMDGDADIVEEMLDSPRPSVEARQRLLVEWLVFHPDDEERADALDAGIIALLDAVMPVDEETDERDTSLAGLVADLKLEEVRREGIAIDATPQVSGCILVFSYLFTAETVAG